MTPPPGSIPVFDKSNRHIPAILRRCKRVTEYTTPQVFGANNLIPGALRHLRHSLQLCNTAQRDWSVCCAPQVCCRMHWHERKVGKRGLHNDEVKENDIFCRSRLLANCCK